MRYKEIEEITEMPEGTIKSYLSGASKILKENLEKVVETEKQIFLQIMYNEDKYFDTEKLLNEALKSEPGYRLSDDFADLVAAKMERKFAWEQYFREFLIYLGAIIGLLAVPVTIQFIFFGAMWQEWVRVVVNNISLIGGVMFLVIFTLFADRVLLRYFMHRSTGEQV